MYRPWEAVLIGIVGGAVASFGIPFFDYLRIDDPVGATSVHGETKIGTNILYFQVLSKCCVFGSGLSALWGVLAIGLFASDESVLNLSKGRSGLFKGKEKA